LTYNVDSSKIQNDDKSRYFKGRKIMAKLKLGESDSQKMNIIWDEDIIPDFVITPLRDKKLTDQDIIRLQKMIDDNKDE